MNNTADKFILRTESPVLDFSKSAKEIYKHILISDSIFDFYPDMEVIINDEGGAVADYLVSGEGLKFTSKLGNDDDGYLESEWVLAENQLQDTKLSYNVGGDYMFGFDSYFLMLDTQKSDAYNDTISNAVSQIIASDFNITSNKMITNTSEIGYRYRFNEFIEDKFEKWADSAYSQSFDKSPFVSFIDAAGKFYFCAIEDLYNQAEYISEDPFVFDMSNESSTNYNAIQDYTILHIGLEDNKDNYRKKIYSTKQDKTSTNEILNIEDFKLSGSGKFFITQDTVELNSVTSTKYFGIIDEVKEPHLKKGWRNSEFFDSYLPFRMQIQILFNKDALSGKKIKLEIGSVISDKNDLSVEYSGDWLIVESRHEMAADARPYTLLTIAKSGTKVDPIQPFKDILV
jgi:hypothetical protein